MLTYRILGTSQGAMVSLRTAYVLKMYIKSYYVLENRIESQQWQIKTNIKHGST